MTIDKIGKYRQRNGNVVEITTLDGPTISGRYPVQTTRGDAEGETWTTSGAFLLENTDDRDLVEFVPEPVLEFCVDRIGQYKMRSGGIAEVTSLTDPDWPGSSSDDRYPIMGTVGGEVVYWAPNGRWQTRCEGNRDLVEFLDEPKAQVVTPVLTATSPFLPVSGEKSRTYFFPGGTFTVENVSAICVRPSGTHRLETSTGKKFIVPAGWVAISIDAEKWSL